MFRLVGGAGASTVAYANAGVLTIFDLRYQQGGSVVHPYPQAGRSFFVTMSYRVRP